VTVGTKPVAERPVKSVDRHTGTIKDRLPEAPRGLIGLTLVPSRRHH
jgi:hypothetical protein